MPVYLFAITEVREPDLFHAIMIFFILHLLVYPASNGYNSYMDRDETSIGGIKKPLQPTRQLYIITLIMDAFAILIGVIISTYFCIALIAYILASRSYSFRGIRLKRFPVIGYLIVILFQGAVTFFMVFHGSSADKTLSLPTYGMIGSSLLIGGFYPLTQVYQHESDQRDGVNSLSMLLGYAGTFQFTAIIYTCAMMVLFFNYRNQHRITDFFVLTTAMLPVLVYFFFWYFKVAKDSRQANYLNTMRMNLIASLSTNLGFIIILMRRFN